MSQFFIAATDSSLPLDVPTSFVTDVGGPAVPVNHILNLTSQSGLTITGSGNTVTFNVQNSNTGIAVTSDALGQTANVLSFSAITDGTYTVEVRVAAFEPATKISAGWSLFALVNTANGIVTVETDTDKIAHVMSGLKAPTAISSVDANILTLGTNIIVQVVGIAGKTIDWGAFSVYIYRG